MIFTAAAVVLLPAYLVPAVLVGRRRGRGRAAVAAFGVLGAAGAAAFLTLTASNLLFGVDLLSAAERRLGPLSVLVSVGLYTLFVLAQLAASWALRAAWRQGGPRG